MCRIDIPDFIRDYTPAGGWYLTKDGHHESLQFETIPRALYSPDPVIPKMLDFVPPLILCNCNIVEIEIPFGYEYVDLYGNPFLEKIIIPKSVERICYDMIAPFSPYDIPDHVNIRLD